MNQARLAGTDVARTRTAGPPSTGAAPVVRVVVIAYEAESTVEDVLDRVPTGLEVAELEIVVADDASSDSTAAAAAAWARQHPARPRTQVVRRQHNLGYGGNQIAAFTEAIRDEVHTVVVVHGDGQYPPERIPDLIAPIVAGDADAVFGSRMLEQGAARRGGMPWVRRAGNRALSKVQNLLTASSLSEWHSGFRAYRVSALDELDLSGLPTDFAFDTAITLQLLERRRRLTEIAIPTRYGEEISRIPLVRTGLRIAGLTVKHSLTALRHRA